MSIVLTFTYNGQEESIELYFLMETIAKAFSEAMRKMIPISENSINMDVKSNLMFYAEVDTECASRTFKLPTIEGWVLHLTKDALEFKRNSKEATILSIEIDRLEEAYINLTKVCLEINWDSEWHRLNLSFLTSQNAKEFFSSIQKVIKTAI